MCGLSFWPALPHSTAAGFRVGLAGPERAQGGSSVYLLYESLTSCLSSSTHLVKAVASPPRPGEEQQGSGSACGTGNSPKAIFGKHSLLLRLTSDWFLPFSSSHTDNFFSSLKEQPLCPQAFAHAVPST